MHIEISATVPVKPKTTVYEKLTLPDGMSKPKMIAGFWSMVLRLHRQKKAIIKHSERNYDD